MAEHIHDDEFDEHHARVVHPLRAMIENHCYLDGVLDFEQNGMALLLMDGLILIPVIMFAFFYPLQTLMWVGGVLLVLAALYESCVLWKKRHPVKS